MTVSVERQLDGAVTEEALHHLRMHACFQQHAGSAVSKVVDPDPGQARMLQRVGECPVHRARANRSAVAVGEHQAGLKPSLRGPPA